MRLSVSWLEVTTECHDDLVGLGSSLLRLVGPFQGAVPRSEDVETI